MEVGLAARFSLLRIQGDEGRCNEWMVCVKTGPMDIRVPEYVKSGQQVLFTECSLCQTCITACAPGVLKLSFGFDLGGKDLLREKIGSEAGCYQ